ncbi:MAG: GNAT family N-acetyltransferase [Candidatus Binatia bacterium]
MAVAFSYGHGLGTPLRSSDEVLNRVHALHDGTLVRLRHLGPADADELRAGFARLSPESRYRRFFSPMPRLTDAMVRRLVGTDGHDHVALVAETLPARNEHPVPLGVARFIRVNGRPSAAEVAVTVIDEMHGRGLGHLLLEAIAALAREHGVTMIVASVLAENAPMNALIRSMGRVASLRRDQGVLLYEVPLRH